MSNYNKKYRLKVLDAASDVDKVGFGFSLSAPSKIAGGLKAAFSLPAGPDFTCPGATKACEGCYAQKGRHMFGNVIQSFTRNWVTMSFYEARNDADGCAAALLDIIDSGLPAFRIHESGDFANQFAIDVWQKVVSARPNTKFWAYTRSFDLDFSQLLSSENFTLWASTDQFNSDAARDFVSKYNIKHAYGPIDENGPIPQNSVVCPVTSGRLGVEGACFECQLCITSTRTKKHIAFLAH